MPRESERRKSRAEQSPEEYRDRSANGGAWFTTTIFQTGVAIVGLIAVLFALSMAIGIDLLGMLADALSTQTGQWLAIAFVIILLTGAAIRALAYTRPPP